MVSIILPTYNRANHLTRALNSILNQTHRDWELIVYDDGSTDQTREIFETWLDHVQPQNPVIFLPGKRNLGVSAARNHAVAASTRPWLAFLDSDDEWLPDKLERQLKASSGFTLIHGEEIWIRNGVRVNAMKKHRKGGGRLFKRCVDLCCISPSTVLLDRQLFLQVGGFDESFPVCEDYDLWLRLCAEHDVAYISDPLIIKYGGHADQLSRRFFAMDHYRVKALLPFLNDKRLSEDERQHVRQTIEMKTEILLKGYRKHGHLAQVEEVLRWRTQFQITHSAADLCPRSLPSPNL